MLMNLDCFSTLLIPEDFLNPKDSQVSLVSQEQVNDEESNEIDWSAPVTTTTTNNDLDWSFEPVKTTNQDDFWGDFKSELQNQVQDEFQDELQEEIQVQKTPVKTETRKEITKEKAIEILFKYKRFKSLQRLVLIRVLAPCFIFLYDYIMNRKELEADSTLYSYPSLLRNCFQVLTSKFELNSTFIQELFGEFALQMNLMSGFLYLDLDLLESPLEQENQLQENQGREKERTKLGQKVLIFKNQIPKSICYLRDASIDPLASLQHSLYF